MKEDITQSDTKKQEPEKNEPKCSSIPKIISFACSKCSKALSYEDAYLVDTGQKVTTWRSENAALLAFYCEACLPAKKQIGKK